MGARGRLVVVPLLAGVVVLAGCGGDPSADYCASLRADRAELAGMVSSEAGPAALLDGLPLLRDLAEQAPRDLVDEWQALVGAVENLDDALRDAGLEPKDFRGGVPPAGTDPAQVRAIAAAASQLASPDIAEAASGIEQQARDVCKVNIGL